MDEEFEEKNISEDELDAFLDDEVIDDEIPLDLADEEEDEDKENDPFLDGEFI